MISNTARRCASMILPVHSRPLSATCRTIAVTVPAQKWRFLSSSSSSSFSTHHQSTTFENDNIKNENPESVHNYNSGRQIQRINLWNQYLETGEGSKELFETFLKSDFSSSSSSSPKTTTFSAFDFQIFLERIGNKGIGDIEIRELKDMKDAQMDLKRFQTWLRHATHDWSIHV